LSSGGEMRSRLQERVEEADLTLTLHGRAGKTPKWAEANIERAEALIALAAQEEGGDAFSCYDQAIEAYEQALEVYTPQSYLGEWGGVIVSLVRALRTYAAREGGHMGLLRLTRGKKLLDTVIGAMPEGRGQFDRAMLMIEQAHICRVRCDIDRVSEREGHLHDAIACFEEAARILRLKENFDNWATAIIGQAMAWRELAALAGTGAGDASDILSALLRSVELFRAAANYYSPERGLDDWVFCHFEQGRTLLRLARVVGGEACRQAAEEAVVCFKKALEHIRQEYTPELWMRCHIDMAFSFIKLEAFGSKRQVITLIEEEIAIFRMASDYYAAQAETATFCVMVSSLGQKLLQLADLKGAEEGRHLRLQALDALRHSVCDELKNIAPDDWLSHIVDLGIALHNVATHQDSRQRGELSDEAVRVYRRALQYIDEQNNDNASALLRNRLGRLLTILGEDDDSQAGFMRLEEAHACFRQAVGYYDAMMQQWEKGGEPNERTEKIVLDLIRFKNNFASLLYALAQRLDDAQAQDYLSQAFLLLSHVLELVKTRCATSEWYEAYALYGRVFKHRLQRGFIEDRPAQCELAAAVLREALDEVKARDVASDEGEDRDEARANSSNLSRLILCRHLADIVYMWGRMLPKAAARPLLDEAHDLIVQLHDWAEQSGFDDVIQSSEEELKSLETLRDSYRRGWMWRRLWSWLRSIEIRWAS